MPYAKRGEIANLPAHNFCMRLVAVEAKEFLSGITLLISEEPSEKTTQKVIKQSRLKDHLAQSKRLRLKRRRAGILSQVASDSSSYRHKL